jgi:hypothetical protein
MWTGATCRRFESAEMSAHSKILANLNWPHAPKHWLYEPGIYMVTAGTYQKLPHLNSPERCVRGLC